MLPFKIIDIKADLRIEKALEMAEGMKIKIIRLLGAQYHSFASPKKPESIISNVASKAISPMVLMSKETRLQG